MISTINGDVNIGFYKELAAAGISADDIPVIAFSVGEEELSGLDTANLTGDTAVMGVNHHLAKPVLIGEIQADGQFDIISQTNVVPGDA